MRKNPKSMFHKLYLIEKEMYDRIVPYLNQVDKQEIDDLNDDNKPHYQGDEPSEDETTGVEESHLL